VIILTGFKLYCIRSILFCHHFVVCIDLRCKSIFLFNLSQVVKSTGVKNMNTLRRKFVKILNFDSEEQCFSTLFQSRQPLVVKYQFVCNLGNNLLPERTWDSNTGGTPRVFQRTHGCRGNPVEKHWLRECKESPEYANYNCQLLCYALLCNILNICSMKLKTNEHGRIT
jgi:hypothetical protein